MIGEKIDIQDKIKFNKILKHYSDRFYLDIKGFNTILSEKELKQLSYEFIKKTILTVESNKCDFRVNIGNRIIDEIALYKTNNENIIRRYVLLFGTNNKIVKYYSMKYKYLLEKYECSKDYDYLCKNFDKIVKESLLDIKKISFTFKKAINKNLIKYSKKNSINAEEEISLIRNNKIGIDEVYKNYSYIKKGIFKRFKDKFNLSDDELMFLIDKKYLEFICAYFNGTSSSEVYKYLNTRLSEYFNKCNPLTKEDRDLINIIYYEYYDLIDFVINKFETFVSYSVAKVMLEETYLELIYCYYLMNKNYDLENYFNKKFDKQVSKLLDNCSLKDFRIIYEDNEENMLCKVKKIKKGVYNGLK